MTFLHLFLILLGSPTLQTYLGYLPTMSQYWRTEKRKRKRKLLNHHTIRLKTYSSPDQLFSRVGIFSSSSIVGPSVTFSSKISPPPTSDGCHARWLVGPQTTRSTTNTRRKGEQVRGMGRMEDQLLIMPSNAEYSMASSCYCGCCTLVVPFRY